MLTVLRDCDWIVRWDEDQGHVYERGGDVAFGDRLVHIGGRYDGAFDIELSGRGKMVMPGLVNIHCHPFLEPIYRGLREEHGLQHNYMSGMYERSVAFWPDEADMPACADVAYCEMMLSGVTTVCDQSFPYSGWIDTVARSGLRIAVAPQYASASWTLDAVNNLGYRWDEKTGRDRFDLALKLVDDAAAHPSGRLSGVLVPAQIDTCTVDLLTDSMAAALARGIPISTHAGQSVPEFHEMVRRTGMTPIQFMAKHRLLAPNMTIGHCIFIDDHSWLHWKTNRDLRSLVETGTSVAHCPTVFSRYGTVLESVGSYGRAGVNVAIGTDAAPHNMIEEMRTALILCKTFDGDVNSTSLRDVFSAATVGGARALMRDDIGRLLVGCCADVVVVDLACQWMRPARDPLRSLTFHAADRAVQDVFVGGEQVVRDGVVLTLDAATALDRVTEAQERMMAKSSSRHPVGKVAEQVSPLTLPRWSASA